MPFADRALLVVSSHLAFAAEIALLSEEQGGAEGLTGEGLDLLLERKPGRLRPG